MFPPSQRFDIFQLSGGYSKGLDVSYDYVEEIPHKTTKILRNSVACCCRELNTVGYYNYFLYC